MKEVKIIFRFFSNSLQQHLTNIPIFIMFFFSKLARYGLFVSFLYFLVSGTTALSGYTTSQILFFYLTFVCIDTAVQLLFREVYRFRPLIVSGGFDMILAKPMNPLIRVLLGGPDFIDAGVLVILLSVMLYITASTLEVNFASVVLFIAMLVNTFIIATAFHILVLAVGILTLSIDHLIMVYRDIVGLMRIPVDAFTNPLRFLITFVIPLGIMFTFPAKAILGLLAWPMVLISFFVGLTSIWLSLKFWHFALKNYSSASS